ncbi:MAG: dockerin type I domain-containing protein [bacterium]|nr:dockerin type I domain-containing protein [bacterium]
MKWLVSLAVLLATVSAWAQSPRDVVILDRVFNDDSDSISNHVKNLPTVILSDTKLDGDGRAPEFANRHIWFVSADGQNPLQIPLDEEWKLEFDLVLTGTPITPRKEAGGFARIGMPWGYSELQFMVNTDANEVVAFGYPFPFYKFNLAYYSGDTIRLGIRFFKDTDGRYKVVYMANELSSPALALADQHIIVQRKWITPGGYLQVNIQAGNPNNGGTAVFNNIRWNGALLRHAFAIRGNIELRDYSGDVTQVPIRAELRLDGMPVRTETLFTDSAGNYVIPEVVPGTYDVAFKASHWLRAVVPNVTVVDADVTGVDASLTNGDIDGDNEVSLLDFGALVAAFGSTPGGDNWNPNADLDGDGDVSLLDFGILVQNFGAVGDE